MVLLGMIVRPDHESVPNAMKLLPNDPIARRQSVSPVSALPNGVYTRRKTLPTLLDDVRSSTRLLSDEGVAMMSGVKVAADTFALMVELVSAEMGMHRWGPGRPEPNQHNALTPVSTMFSCH